MRNIAVITIKLLVITIIAGLVLGVVNAMTKEPIAAQEAKAADEARKAAFSEASSFELIDIEIPEKYAIIQNIYNALDENGKPLGVTAAVITKGFNAGLNLTVGIGADGTIKGVIVGSHEETPGLGAKAAEPAFQDQFKGKSYATALFAKKAADKENDIQAITGATITSKGVTDAVNITAKFYTEMIGGAQ